MKRSLVHRLLSSIRFRIRQWHVRSANLKWSTETNVHITISNHCDWVIFNEVFASGEYDYAINLLLKSTATTTGNVLDLGANIGLFTLRLIHLASSLGHEGKLSVKAIEATPSTFSRLSENIKLQPALPKIQIELHHGLIGSKEGVGSIYLYANHVLNSTIYKTGKTAQVAYINLDKVTSGWDEIDLIKCDIEGSELSFIQNYPEILKKTKAAIVEFHYDEGSRQECLKRLAESGLIHRQIIRQHSHSSVEYFRR